MCFFLFILILPPRESSFVSVCCDFQNDVTKFNHAAFTSRAFMFSSPPVFLVRRHYNIYPWAVELDSSNRISLLSYFQLTDEKKQFHRSLPERWFHRHHHCHYQVYPFFQLLWKISYKDKDSRLCAEASLWCFHICGRIPLFVFHNDEIPFFVKKCSFKFCIYGTWAKRSIIMLESSMISIPKQIWRQLKIVEVEANLKNSKIKIVKAW